MLRSFGRTILAYATLFLLPSFVPGGIYVASAAQCIEVMAVIPNAPPGGMVSVDVEWFHVADVTFAADYASKKVDVKATKPPFKTEGPRKDNLFCNPDPLTPAVALVRARESKIIKAISEAATAGSMAALGAICPPCDIALAVVSPVASSINDTGTASSVEFEVRSEEDWVYVGVPSSDYVTTVLIVDAGPLGTSFNVLKSKKTHMPAAIAYPDCDFGGTAAYFGLGVWDMGHMKDLGMPDDTLSSISVAPQREVTLHEQAGFKGTTRKISGQEKCLDGSWDDKTSSIMILPKLN